jgi:hypothetical protein
LGNARKPLLATEAGVAGHGYVSTLEPELMTLDRRRGADLLKTGLLGGRHPALLRAYIWGGVFLIFSCRSESPPAASDAPSSVLLDEKGPLQTISPRAGVSAEHPADASLIELISSPERFRGLWVRVIGYVVLEFEGNAVYMHEEDFVHGIMRNALWLEVSSNGPPTLARPGYAIVEGRFAADVHGHMGLFSGALTELRRISPWVGRQAAP